MEKLPKDLENLIEKYAGKSFYEDICKYIENKCDEFFKEDSEDSEWGWGVDPEDQQICQITNPQNCKMRKMNFKTFIETISDDIEDYEISLFLDSQLFQVYMRILYRGTWLNIVTPYESWLPNSKQVDSVEELFKN